MTALQHSSNDVFPLTPNPNHSNYQEGYAAGKAQALDWSSDRRPDMSQNCKSSSLGESSQWNHGYAQALYDYGMSDWSPFFRQGIRMQPSQRVQIKQDDSQGRAKEGQTGRLAGVFLEFVIVELDKAHQDTDNLIVVTTTLENLLILSEDDASLSERCTGEMG